MKTTIELNSIDIAEIVAKHFNTTPDNVVVSTKKEWKGSGRDERMEAVPVVKVIKEENSNV